MSTPLLTTKFFPPVPRAQMVSRQRLVERIANGLHAGCRLILVSAPAGFGKSTLVVEAIQNTNRRTAWLSLDAAENDLILFWRYVVASLRRTEPGIGEMVQATLEASQPPPLETILTTLINDLAGLPEPLLLVLDDYQVIDNSAVHNSLVFFLDHLPPQLSIAVTTRADPPLSLARRRGRMELVELRAGDLRFTAEESARFLNVTMRLDLSPAQVEVLARRTEGWIAGLHMVALALQAHTADDQADRQAFINSFTGDDHYIGDYLVEEVLQRQPPPIQEFLLHTAILERLSGALCNAVTGREDGQDLLVALHHANLFVTPLDNRQEWYRYHRLFSELLLRRLRQTLTPAQIKDLHARASHWFAAQEQWSDAIYHARQAGDEELAARWVEACAELMFRSSEIPLWREWVLSLPQEIVVERPGICIFWSWAALATGHTDEVIRATDAIEKKMGVTADLLYQGREVVSTLSPDLVNLLVGIASQRIAFVLGAEAIEQCQKLLACLAYFEGDPAYHAAVSMVPVIQFNLGVSYELSGEPQRASQSFAAAEQTSLVYENPHIYTMAISHMAHLLMIGGQLSKAIQTFLRAIEPLSEVKIQASPLSSLVYAGLGEAHYERNELDEAQHFYEQSVALARSWNNWESIAIALPGLARICFAHGDPRKGLQYLEEGAALWRRAGNSGINPLIEICLALYSPDPLKRKETLAGLEQLDFPPGINISHEVATFALSRLLIADGRPENALENAGNLLARARASGLRGWVLRALVQKVVALDQLHREGEALAALEEAVALAEPEGYRRVFLDEGLVMARSLYQLARVGVDTGEYARKLLAAFPPDIFAGEDATMIVDLVSASGETGTPETAELVEPLSEREIEVLRLVAQGLSNQQVAARLVISPGTVKVHNNNINAKLGVGNRTAAVAKARKLGLL